MSLHGHRPLPAIAAVAVPARRARRLLWPALPDPLRRCEEWFSDAMLAFSGAGKGKESYPDTLRQSSPLMTNESCERDNTTIRDG